LKKIAIFDLDNTIISVDSLICFISFILIKYPFKFIYLPYLLFRTFLKIFKIISIEEFKTSWLILIKGLKLNELDRLSKSFIENKVIPKIKKGALDEIARLKNDNFTLILATASFEFYTKHVFEYLKFDYHFATIVEYNDKNFIYKLSGINCKNEEKINRITKVISKNDILIEESLGYSDSLTDLPFLELTQNFYYIDKKFWKVKRVYH